MPIIELEGVGKVELDDSFLAQTPAQQQATLDQIEREARSALRKQTSPTSPDAAPPLTQPQAGPIEPQDPSLPPAPPSGPGPRFDAKWMAEQEAAYQAEQADRHRTKVGDGPPPTVNRPGIAGGPNS